MIAIATLNLRENGVDTRDAAAVVIDNQATHRSPTAASQSNPSATGGMEAPSESKAKGTNRVSRAGSAWICLINDLIWWVPFAAIPVRAFIRRAGGVRQTRPPHASSTQLLIVQGKGE